MSRERVALEPPNGSLATFPVTTLTPAQTLVRGHRTSNSPWWFTCSGSGRFDRTSPRGTCYLALDANTAIRETVGAALTASRVISQAFADERQLSTLTVPRDYQIADTASDRAADFGLTRELVTVTPYFVPQQWATAFDRAGFAGLRYQSRFTTGTTPNAVALFADAGEADWPIDPDPEPLTAAARRNGFTVTSPPRSVRIVSPPTE